MRRKFRYYVNDRPYRAKDFWMQLKRCYVHVDFSLGQDATITIEDQLFKEATRAIKNGYPVVPTCREITYPTLFRREEIYE